MFMEKQIIIRMTMIQPLKQLIKLKSNYLCRIESNYISKLTITIQLKSANGNDGLTNTTLDTYQIIKI